MVEFIALSFVTSLFYLLVFSRERTTPMIPAPIFVSERHR